MSGVHSWKVIRRRRHRREKLRKLRQRYLAASTAEEREKILEKVFRVAPTVTREQFLASLPQAQTQTQPTK
jgi:hypothetical protein